MNNLAEQTTPVAAHYEAMLVDLRISCWTARKQDKKISKEAAQKHGIAEHLGAYYKSLIESPELTEVARLTSAARDCHYRWTLPWLDSGQRVLPSAAFFDYTNEIGMYKSEFNAAVNQFVAMYPQRQADAQQLLGSMFNANDYPGVSQVQDKFAFKLHVSPVPAGDDFRCDIGEAQVQAIRDDITKATNDTMVTAVASLYSRMAEVVSAFVDRLGDSDKVFRDSLVENARALVKLLPKLNVTNDPDIAAMCTKIEAALCTFEPNELRHNPAVRAKVHARATQLNDTLADFLSGR